MIKVKTDVDTIEDAGFNKYLARSPWIMPSQEDPDFYRKAGNMVGGTLGTGGTLNIGAGNIKIDSENKRIIINDGSNDIILIGWKD